MEGNGLFSLFVIFLAVAIAPLIASCIPHVRVPGVVVEIVLGILDRPLRTWAGRTHINARHA